MWNRYQPYRRGIRFFPHIIPIAFPLIFPIGFGLLLSLLHELFPVFGILLVVALAFFVYRAITLGSSAAAWNSMKNTGYQWQQRFTSRNQQPPYNQPQQPYYQPSSPAGQEQPSQPYGQGYQPEQPYYRPSEQSNDSEQPQAQYPRQMQSNESNQPRTQHPQQLPPMQQ